MSEATVRKAILQDSLDLAPKIRKNDREEIRASNNSTPLKALVEEFTIENNRIYSIVKTEDNSVIGMFNVSFTHINCNFFSIKSYCVNGNVL